MSWLYFRSLLGSCFSVIMNDWSMERRRQGKTKETKGNERKRRKERKGKDRTGKEERTESGVPSLLGLLFNIGRLSLLLCLFRLCFSFVATTNQVRCDYREERINDDLKKEGRKEGRKQKTPEITLKGKGKRKRREEENREERKERGREKAQSSAFFTYPFFFLAPGAP